MASEHQFCNILYVYANFTTCNAMLAAVKDLSTGEGALTQRLSISSQDEIGLTAQALNEYLVK